MSRRVLAWSISTRIAWVADWNPPGATWSSAIGTVAGVRLRREVLREVGRQRAAVAAEAHQEERLGLAHDVPGHPHHHVVELAVREVVLDPGATGPRDGAVDHVELAMVGVADVVLAPVELTVVRVQAVLVPREQVVDDDLRPGVGQPGEHRPRRPEDLASLAVHDDPHLDALLHLLHEEVGELGADLPFAPPEHEDVDRGVGLLDVGEDPREEVLPLGPRLDRRGRRPGVGHPDVGRLRVRPCREPLRRQLRARGGDRARRGRPARLLLDHQHLLVDDVEERREQEPENRESRPPPAPDAAGPRRRRALGCLAPRRSSQP